MQKAVQKSSKIGDFGIHLGVENCSGSLLGGYDCSRNVAKTSQEMAKGLKYAKRFPKAALRRPKKPKTKPRRCPRASKSTKNVHQDLQKVRKNDEKHDTMLYEIKPEKGLSK